jgi:hypothetical protein
VAVSKTCAAQRQALAQEPAGGKVHCANNGAWKEPYVLETVFTAPEPLHAGQPAYIRLP